MKTLSLFLLLLFFGASVHAQTASAATDESIFTGNIDTMPVYEAGMDNFYARLSQIRYTFSDRMSECQGRVTLLMLIEKDGTVSDIKIRNGISVKQDEEILRIARRLAKWKPGMANGRPVTVLVAIPIDFKLIKS